MRIFSLTVGRNEAHRYLHPVLDHCLGIFDDVFYFDDGSDDESVEIAHDLNCTVYERPPTTPTFLDNEGMFRAEAWMRFEELCQPAPGDWVLINDCDEVLVSWYGSDEVSVRLTLEKVCAAASGHPAVMLEIPEVWGFDEDGCPLIRMDGLWNTIHAPRLVAYRPGGQYVAGDLGVPAVPSYAQRGPWFGTDTLRLMHYGYAAPQDAGIKYERYTGRTGHGNAHVESIISLSKELVRWDWPYLSSMETAWTQLM